MAERRGLGVAGVTAGTAAFGGAAVLGRIEDRHNGRVQRRNAARRAELSKPYGYDPVTRKPVEDPRARAHAIGFPATREHKRKAREAVKTKHRMLHEFETTKPRGIPLAARAGRRWGLVAAGGALTYGGARQLVDKRVTRDDVDSAALGGALGVGFYQAPHWASRPLDRRNERTIAQDDHLRHVNRRHKDAHVPRNAGLGHPAWTNYFRTLPKELPGAKRKRVFSHTHAGRSGAALNIGAAMLGAGSAVGHSRSSKVAKTLYQREERLSPVRAGGYAAGAALGAWGLGRSGAVGRALGRGMRMAASKDNTRAVEALQLAMAAQGALARGTAPGERALRQIRRVDAAVRAVPAPMRPEVAMAAGALLAGSSSPVHRTTYRPVSRPVTVRGASW